MIPLLKPLYDYNWVVGLIGAFVAYLVLALLTTIKPVTNKEEASERPGASRIDPAAVDG